MEPMELSEGLMLAEHQSMGGCSEGPQGLVACPYVGLACASGRAFDAQSARGVRRSIPSPAGGLRAVGLSFIHGTSGPRLRYAALSNPAFRPFERGLLLILRACTPRSRSLPQPPPPPQPWPPSGVHSHRADPYLCALCALCAALVRRIERPNWPSGRLPGRQEQRVRCSSSSSSSSSRGG